ncbi:MAG: DUF4115 domain-containing protein [Hydrogenophilus sp.]|nr:DUF4115 domain-containing protein [Hydrogenophilus sp.]
MGGGGSSGGGGGNYERGGGGLVVRASRGDSWLRVTAADGQVVYEGLLRMGSERTFPAERGPFALHAGNGGALEVLWQGRPVTIRGGVSRFQVPEGGGGGAGTGQRSQGGETMGTSPRLQGETTGVSQRPPGGTAGGSQRAQGGGTGTGQRSQGGETMGISPRLQGETTGVSQRPRGGEGAGSE